MKKSLVFLFFASCFFLSGQKFSTINFDTIKKTLSADTTLYSKLIERMKKMDSTLNSEEYKLIYFGQAFSKFYNPYGSSKDKDEFRQNIKDGKYETALKQFEKLVAANPLDMDTWYRAGVCYKEMGNMLMKKRCFRVFNSLLDCIEQSGDGLKSETAFVTMCVHDEYIVLSDFDLEHSQQSLIGYCDMFDVKKSEKFPHKKIWFNTYWSLKSMDDLFKEK